MKKQKLNNLSLNKKTISNFDKLNITGGSLYPTWFPCWSIDWCPTTTCTEGRKCGGPFAPI